MINLLPPEVKQQYQYARRNVHLVRWLFAMGFALAGLAIISVGGVWYLQQTANQYHKQISVTEESLKKQDQAKVQKEVQNISSSLKLAVQVLSKEVLFSELLKQMATVTPSNATLSDLTISQVQGAVDITARTADYNAATQLQVNLSDPTNKIFSKADIVSINCTTSPTSSDALLQRYPCTVTIRALFATDNPFLFINGAKPATAKGQQ